MAGQGSADTFDSVVAACGSAASTSLGTGAGIDSGRLPIGVGSTSVLSRTVVGNPFSKPRPDSTPSDCNSVPLARFKLTSASPYVVSARKNRAYHKQGSFYLIELLEPLDGPLEADHEAYWMDHKTARMNLQRGFYRWAVEQAIR